MTGVCLKSQSNRCVGRLGCLFALLIVMLGAGEICGASEIKGNITNVQGGEGLGKVRVVVLETDLSAITDNAGNFQITKVPPGSHVLRISSVGYRSTDILFTLEKESDSKEFMVGLVPDNFTRTEKVEVHGDVFQVPDWPSPGDMTMTSSELQQTSMLVANDPFRALQSLPGVSSSGNNELLAQFSVMGAAYENVGIYVDDVLVPNLLHTVPGLTDAPTLSLLTGNDVEELRLMPVAYPVKYADGSGAALAIRTRSGNGEKPLFHVSIGMADTEGVAEGGFGHIRKGTWLVDARKSYLGYLERWIANSPYSQDGFYDASVKLTYELSPNQTVSLLASGGQVGVNDPTLSLFASPYTLKKGTNDLAIGRLGWRWVARPNLVLDARVAYLRTHFEQDNATNTLIENSSDKEWTAGANVTWSWRRGAIFQGGYSFRRPEFENSGNTFSDGHPPSPFSYRSLEKRQDGYVQNSLQFWKDRVRVQCGLRWGRLEDLRVQPITGQASITLQVARNTQVEAGWGHYAELPQSAHSSLGVPFGGSILISNPLPRSSSQYIFAVEQRFGERTRFRAELFDRQNENRFDLILIPGPVSLAQSVLFSRDYSRGLQFVLQRRSENRISGWISYTLVFAESRNYQTILSSGSSIYFNSPYTATFQDQRHTVNAFASYRISPTVRVSAKNSYGSGFPVTTTFPPVLRLRDYERLDLRGEKSWLFKKWKLTLYGELLNATNHGNLRFVDLNFNLITQMPFIETAKELPITPTAGLAFDF